MILLLFLNKLRLLREVQAFLLYNLPRQWDVMSLEHAAQTVRSKPCSTFWFRLVTVTCTAKCEFLRSIGCDRAINYKTENFRDVMRTEYPKG